MAHVMMEHLNKPVKTRHLRDYWLDIRGNHDSFGIPLPLPDALRTVRSDNFFHRFSVVGSFKHTHRHYPHYALTLHIPVSGSNSAGSSYKFVFVDAVPSPPPKRHFFGMYETPAIDFLEGQLREEQKERDKTASTATDATKKRANHTVVVAHYPLATCNSKKSSTGDTVFQVLQRYDFLGMLFISLCACALCGACICACSVDV